MVTNRSPCPTHAPESQDQTERDEHRGKEPPRAPRIEAAQADGPGLVDVLEQNARNQVSGKDKEDVDPDESPTAPVAGVEEEDRGRRTRLSSRRGERGTA